jgi:hypothetical protein
LVDREQQQERDQKRENAERLGHRKAENQAAELAFNRRRVAQRAIQELAEQRTDADAGRPRSNRGEASANIFGGDGKLMRFHAVLLFRLAKIRVRVDEVSDRGEARR